MQDTTNWLANNCSELLSVDTPKILSLGCGRGIFDIEFIKIIQQYKTDLYFTGLDFSATDLDRFRENISNLDSKAQSAVTLKYKKFEQSTDLGERYDLVTMIHFLHSFDDVIPVIKNALKHLSPGGKLLIIQSSEQGIFELKNKFLDILPNQKFQSSDRVKTLLQAENIKYSADMIDTCFDVSIMQAMSLDTLLLMSFCFTNDLSILDTKQQDKIRKAFLCYAKVQKDGSHIIYEPMEAIICYAE